MKNGAPATTKPPIRPLSEPPPDLRVQPVLLPRLHRDVTRERFEQSEVTLRVVGDLPVEVEHDDCVKQSAAFDLLALVGQLAGTGERRTLRYAFSELAVDLLKRGEERVPALGEDVGGAPEREVTA